MSEAVPIDAGEPVAKDRPAVHVPGHDDEKARYAHARQMIRDAIDAHVGAHDTDLVARLEKTAGVRDLHALLGEAMKKSRQGVSQIGSTEPPAGGGTSWLRNAADPRLKIRISDAPSPQLPEK